MTNYSHLSYENRKNIEDGINKIKSILSSYKDENRKLIRNCKLK